MAVLAIVDDLIFRSKLEAAAAEAGVALCFSRDPATPQSDSRDPWRLAIIDVGASSALELITILRTRFPGLPLVGYYAHVDTTLRARAEAAGCDRVLPRSAFIQQLPAILTGALTPPKRV